MASSEYSTIAASHPRASSTLGNSLQADLPADSSGRELAATGLAIAALPRRDAVARFTGLTTPPALIS
jgi:hypothetical protein